MMRRRFDVLTSVLTSRSAKPVDDKVVDRSQAVHFLAANVDILALY